MFKKKKVSCTLTPLCATLFLDGESSPSSFQFPWELVHYLVFTYARHLSKNCVLLKCYYCYTHDQ